MIGIIFVIVGVVGIFLVVNYSSAGNPFDALADYHKLLLQSQLDENIARSDAYWNSHKDISEEERRAGILADRKFWREQYGSLIGGGGKKDEG